MGDLMEEFIFHFHDRPALEVQSDEICQRLYDDFWEKIAQKGAPKGVDVESLQLEYRIEWLSSYACVIVFKKLNPVYTVVKVIGLDGWKMWIHAYTDGRQRTALPNVCEAAQLELGKVLTEKVDDILKEFKQELVKSEHDNAGSDRGQRTGHRGNQKTPSFARAILGQVICNDERSQRVEGGTTDVSLHTGCLPRNTSFPLVLSTVHLMIRWSGERNSEELFNKCVSKYYIAWLDQIAPCITFYDPLKINRCLTIFRELKEFLLAVSDKCFKDVALSRMELHFKHLKDLKVEGKPPLGPDQSIEDSCKSCRPPKFPELPSVVETVHVETKLKQARADAKANLGWSNINNLQAEFPLQALSDSSQDAWVQLCNFNEFFWEIAAKLEHPDITYDISELRNRLTRLIEVIDTINKSCTDTKARHVMKTSLASCRLLAVWIVYCWSYRTTEHTHPVFKRYGPALNAADLNHGVFEDARALAAAENVRRFLQDRSQRPRQPFRVSLDTLALAKDFGLESDYLNRICDEERQIAERQIDERWEIVQAKQKELLVLDKELMQAEKELYFARKQLEVSERRDFVQSRYNGKTMTDAYYRIKKVKDDCESKLNSLKHQIRTWEAKPNDFNICVPDSKPNALQWVFFFYMPEEFRHLSALAQQGQLLLWEEAPSAREKKINLLEWFKNHKLATNNSPGEGALILGSFSSYPRISTPNVRFYTRLTGVFFPDFEMDPLWKDKDPFCDDRDVVKTVMLYTECLPSSADCYLFMKRFVAMLPSPTRENEGIAWREKKPDWLSHEQFLTYTKLRSGPNVQIRYIVEALADDLLPFQHDCVHILVKQALFHAGERCWKMDLLEGWEGLAAISSELRRQLDILRESPKDCDRLVLFGIMSSYFGQFYDDATDCAREYARTARRWAEEVEIEIADCAQVAPELFWKQSKLYGYALLCHSFGDREESDLLEIAELIVLYKNRSLFASDVPGSQTLDEAVRHVMGSRSKGMIAAVEQHLACLTQCLSLVVKDIPTELTWVPVTYEESLNTYCFEATETSTLRLFSINLLNGTILVDGIPPSFLPDSVTKQKSYLRAFGTRNFEIIVLGFRHYRTSRRVEDRFLYEFQVTSDEELRIWEFDTSHGQIDVKLQHRLLLLNPDKMDLPTLLQANHSHWYSENYNAVFVRGTKYKDRLVHYIVTQTSTFCVPFKSRALTLEFTLSTTEQWPQLLLGTTRLTDLLGYFEYGEYIHLQRSPDSSSLRYLLPRFDLTFEHTNEGVSSLEFKGFSLAPTQRLDETLPGVSSLLVIVNQEGRSKVLMPHGKVLSRAQVQVDRAHEVSPEYYIYNIHPRFENLIAMDTVGRLHLASLYVSNASLMANNRIGLPGAAVATDLVRGCWKNEPFSEEELHKLIEVSSHSSLSCTLRMMCTWVWQSSLSVYFLHGLEEPPLMACLEPDCLAIDEYRCNTFACRLLPSEEFSLLGTSQAKCVDTVFPVQADSESEEIVKSTELHLLRHVETVDGGGTEKVFPLQRPTNCCGLEATLYDDLEESYLEFTQLPEKFPGNFRMESLQTVRHRTESRRKLLETVLIEELLNGDHSHEHRFGLIAGTARLAKSRDLLSIFLDPGILNAFGRCETEEFQSDIYCRSLGWAMLCVLEDKLNRIIKAERDGDKHALLIELECKRAWNPALHRRWLAFEVEQQLQIRPNQFLVVKQLLDNKRVVLQLNMGLGKTRVMVPMLILELMSKRVGRVNVLPSIIHEATEYYRSVLVASIQHVQVFTLPFQRDFPLKQIHADILSHEMAECRHHGGCFVVAPQHRNSLLLKQYDCNVFIGGLQEIPFQDIIDESDAILDYMFQLVYALGRQIPLPSGESRWNVGQVLLKMLADGKCDKVDEILSDNSLVHREVNSQGAFPKLRFLRPFKEHEERVVSAICRQLVVSPPYELRWMKSIQPEHTDLLIRIMSDQFFPNTSDAINRIPLFEKYQGDILACRGFLAFGLLFHGLSARYRVDYGLKFTRQMAVPYSASDTPKQRAEYRHPDMAIIYTCLSYYNEGLDIKQFKEALTCVLSLGSTARASIYSEWVESVRCDVDPTVLPKFDDVLKVDAENMVQFEAMFSSFRLSMDVISFWMNNFVFPVETFQFPSNRATSAWNLVDDNDIVGFSGTDDNKKLLPLRSRQLPQNETHLRATNGEMIDRILNCTRRVVVLDDNSNTGKPLWKDVLQRCIELRTMALIDVAGLMAGSQNRVVAQHIAEYDTNDRCRGVVYFDPKKNSWYVFEKKTIRHQLLRRSAVNTTECFAYFDQSRCRGADLKLKEDSCALVTLDRSLTKDKFMQGCARMRKLRPGGQSLILCGTLETVQRNSTARDVLCKIVQHTANTTKAGVLPFYERGKEYASFPDKIDQDVSLDQLYSGSLSECRDLSEYLDAEQEVYGQSGKELIEYCKEIGEGTEVKLAKVSQECERELEKETEEEEEAENEIEKQQPFAQVDWDFSKAFDDPEALFDEVFHPVQDFVEAKLESISSVDWNSNNKLFCSHNFWKTIQNFEVTDDLSCYLRPVNPLLVLRDGRVALLSAYELDNLLPHWWGCASTESKATLQHLNFSVDRSLPTLVSGFGKYMTHIPVNVLTSIKLFRGYVQYSDAEMEVLGDMFRGVSNSRQLSRELLFMRNRSALFERSDLESFTFQLDLDGGGWAHVGDDDM